MASVLLGNVLSPFSFWGRSPSDSLSDLEMVGKLLSTLAPPWTQEGPLSDSFVLRYPFSEPSQETPTLDVPLSPDAAFGLFALLATFLEDANATRQTFFKSSKDSPNPYLQLLLPILLSRYRLTEPARAEESIQTLWQSSHQAQLALAWSHRKVSFVKRAKRPTRKARPKISSS
jgi:hypothetical protein